MDAYAMHLAMAALVGASFVAVSAYYMHRKTLDQLLKFAKTFEKDSTNNLNDELLQHYNKQNKGSRRNEVYSGAVEDDDGFPVGLPKLRILPEGKSTSHAGLAKRASLILRPTSPKSPVASASAFESVEGSNEDVDVNENENADLDAGYLHTNGNAGPENANADANGEQLPIAAAALIRSHSVSGDLHGVQPEPEQETFVRLRITPYETPSPDEAEVYKALQVCLEMRDSYVFRESIAPREQKRDASGKQSGTPAGKRGRPQGSTQHNMAVAAMADINPASLLGPSLQVHSTFADQNNKRLVFALQSGLKSELTWALNTLTLLSFKEKDDVRKDATPLAKIPGLLDALLQVIDDWRDIALPKELIKTPRTRSIGVNATVTGFGNEYKASGSNDVSHPNIGSASGTDASVQKKSAKSQPSEWWLAEDGLFNLDDEGRAERQQCAVAASNILRNFSFMPENEVIMGQHRHCLETIFQCMEDHLTEDEELVTNCLETIVNLAPLLDLRIFSSTKPSYIKITEKRAVQAIMGILGSSVKGWHCAAAELIGRVIINPDNEPFLLPSAPQIYKRLVDLLSFPIVDAQAAAVGALYNLVEVNMDCRLKLASERWAIDRLLKVIRAPHPVPEVCRKAAIILESLVSEPQNRPHLLAYENAFAEILFSDGKHSDTFARILYELTTKPNSKVATARGIWGM